MFTADDDHGLATLGHAGTIWTKIAWTGSDRLRITYASGARVFRHLAASGGVAITYDAAEPALPSAGR